MASWRSAAATAGWPLTRYQVHDSVLAVVSCPASSMVMSWSRSPRQRIWASGSPSDAAASSEIRSLPWPFPAGRRAASRVRTASSSSRRAARNRKLRGSGSHSGTAPRVTISNIAWPCATSKAGPSMCSCDRSASSSIRPRTSIVSAVISRSQVDGTRAHVGVESLGEGGARVRDHAGEAGHALAAERRGDHLALPPPGLPLAGQQPVAQCPAGLGKPHSLAVVRGVVGQHVLGVIGMVEEVDGLGSHVEPDHVPVLAGRVGQQAQPVAPELAQQPGDRAQRRPRVGARPGRAGGREGAEPTLSLTVI